MTDILLLLSAPGGHMFYGGKSYALDESIIEHAFEKCCVWEISVVY